MKHKLTNLFIAALMTACSSTPNKIFPDITKMIPRESEERSIEANVIAPEWTTLTSGVYKESKGKAVFYGLGKVEKQELISDRKMLSEDRARNELAKVFDSYIKRLAKEVTGSKLSNSVTGVHRDRLGSSLDERTATILMEAEITQYWSNKNNGKVYSMAQLDLNRLTDKLDSTKSISPEDRSFLKESIVRAHSSMANEQTVQLQFAKEEISSPTQLERQLSY